MTIRFNFIPADIRVPGVYVEYDGSRTADRVRRFPLRILLIGQKSAAGTAPALVRQRLLSRDAGVAAFGRGSRGARMAAALKVANDATEAWMIAVDDAAGSTAATGTITVTGPATANGTIALIIDGVRVVVGVSTGQTATQIAVAIVAAVAALPDLSVTAANVAGVVTLTAISKGTQGNDILVSHSFYDGEALPAGVALAIAAFAGGATDPDLTEVWAALGEADYDIVILPFGDAAALNSADAEMERRVGPLVAKDALCGTALRGSVAAVLALGEARNDRFISRMPIGASPIHPAEAAAAIYATAAFHLENDPAAPIEGISVRGMIAPKAGQYIFAERNQMLRSGLSTFAVDGNGAFQIERLIMQFQRNGQGLDDPSWYDINTPVSLSFLRKSLRSRRERFKGYKLVNNGTPASAVSKTVSASALAADTVGWYQQMIDLGICDDMEGFKKELIVERDEVDRNRTNEILPIRLVGQLRVQAVKFDYQF